MLSPVRPSVRHTGGSVKTVEFRIMKFSPYSSPIALVSHGKLFRPDILTGPPAGASNNGGVAGGENEPFLADRTNGRAYAIVLRPSVVVVCNVMYCG